MKSYGSTILLGLVAFGLTFGVMHFIKKRNAGNVPQVVSEKAPPAAAPIDEKAEPIEFTETALSGSGASYSVRFGFTIKKGCFVGELDAIDMDVSHSSEENILISLEPIGGGSYVAHSKKLSRSDLSVGLQAVDFSDLKSGSPENLMLYICKDSSGKKQCADKPYMRVDDLVVSNSQESTKGDYQAPDRIYFAQYLYWDGAGKVSYFKRTPRTPDFKIPGRDITSEKKTMWDKFSSVSSRLSVLIPTLQSYPLHMRDNKLMFELARHDRAQCK